MQKKDSNYNINYQYNYYPLDTGHYVIYNVDSINYAFSNPIYIRDTVTYQWMEKVTDTFYDNSNRLNYRIECYRRSDSSQPWISQVIVWSAYLNTTYLELQEDNLPFVKLTFPPQLNVPWNGNEFLPVTAPYDVFQNWNYFYESIDTSITSNGQNYSNVLIVNEVDQETFVNKILREEMYAPKVGMVYQAWEVLQKQNVSTSWDTGAESGYRIRMNVWQHNP